MPAKATRKRKPQIAVAKIQVTDFNPVLDPNNYTAKTMRLHQGTSRVEGVPSRTVPGDIETLRIKGGGGTIRFDLEPEGEYVPIGIAYVQRSRHNGGPLGKIGRHVFNIEHSNLMENSIRVRGQFPRVGKRWETKSGKQKDWRFEFFLIIQRVRDGQIGIIDPGIENGSE
jgi:hypothetical protein